MGGTALAVGSSDRGHEHRHDDRQRLLELGLHAKGELTGTIGQNNKAKDDFIPITEGRFLGGGTEGLCESSFNFVTAFNCTGTPSELILERKGGAQWRFPRFRMTPLEDVNNPPGHKEACVAASNAVKGTFPLTTTPQPLTVTFSNVKMHLEADHGHECSGKKGHNPYMSATLHLHLTRAAGRSGDLRTRMSFRAPRVPPGAVAGVARLSDARRGRLARLSGSSRGRLPRGRPAWSR